MVKLKGKYKCVVKGRVHTSETKRCYLEEVPNLSIKCPLEDIKKLIEGNDV